MKLFTLDNENYFVISKISEITKNNFDDIDRWSLTVYMNNGDCYSQTYEEEKDRDDIFYQICKEIEDK